MALPFHLDFALPPCHPVARSSPMVQSQGFQRPVGIGNHANSTFLPDEDGHWGTRFAMAARRLGGLQDFAGMVQE